MYVNIDWKRGRHDTRKSEEKNLEKLTDLVEKMVATMKPSLICMCEVGECMNPLLQEHFDILAKATMQAWNSTATEQVNLHAMYVTGAPYLTVYDALQGLFMRILGA